MGTRSSWQFPFRLYGLHVQFRTINSDESGTPSAIRLRLTPAERCSGRSSMKRAHQGSLGCHAL
jgi:hypothetical protein